MAVVRLYFRQIPELYSHEFGVAIVPLLVVIGDLPRGDTGSPVRSHHFEATVHFGEPGQDASLAHGSPAAQSSPTNQRTGSEDAGGVVKAPGF